MFKNKINDNLKIIINELLLQLSIYYLILTLGIIYYLLVNINIINNININDKKNNKLIDDYPINNYNLNILIILILLLIIIYLKIKLSKNQYDLLK